MKKNISRGCLHLSCLCAARLWASAKKQAEDPLVPLACAAEGHEHRPPLFPCPQVRAPLEKKLAEDPAFLQSLAAEVAGLSAKLSWV